MGHYCISSVLLLWRNGKFLTKWFSLLFQWTKPCSPSTTFAIGVGEQFSLLQNIKLNFLSILRKSKSIAKFILHACPRQPTMQESLGGSQLSRQIKINISQHVQTIFLNLLRFSQLLRCTLGYSWSRLFKLIFFLITTRQCKDFCLDCWDCQHESSLSSFVEESGQYR